MPSCCATWYIDRFQIPQRRLLGSLTPISTTTPSWREPEGRHAIERSSQQHLAGYQLPEFSRRKRTSSLTRERANPGTIPHQGATAARHRADQAAANNVASTKRGRLQALFSFMRRCRVQSPPFSAPVTHTPAQAWRDFPPVFSSRQGRAWVRSSMIPGPGDPKAGITGCAPSRPAASPAGRRSGRADSSPPTKLARTRSVRRSRPNKAQFSCRSNSTQAASPTKVAIHQFRDLDGRRPLGPAP